MFMAMNSYTCERCGDERGEKDMSGAICGWCAADISRIDVATQEEVAQYRGHRNHDPGQLALTDADVAILWHARMAQDDRHE